MMKCPKCNHPVDIWDDVSAVCNHCHYEWDLQDEELAQQRLYAAVKSLFPKVEEDSIACESEALADRVRSAQEKAERYDKIRSLVGEFVSNAYHTMTIITPENQRFLQDIVFSIYNEKNQTEHINIYPKKLITKA